MDDYGFTFIKDENLSVVTNFFPAFFNNESAHRAFV